MKYCVIYNQQTSNKSLINEADEWTIEFNLKDNTLEEFIKNNKEKRINLFIKINDFDIQEKINLELLETLCKKYYNLYIEFDKFDNEYFKILKDTKIRYFFRYFISNWDKLYEMFDYNVTDVRIVENLGFELDKVSAVAHSKNTRIRVFPHIAQSCYSEMKDLKKFFIRPEDTKIYEKYIDVYDFLNEDALFYLKVYKIDKEWFGQLKELIIDFKDDIDNKYIIPRFAEKRIKCNKKCLKGDNCKMCDTIEELANTLNKSKIIVTIPKERNE